MSHQRGSGSGATSGQGHMSAEAEEELLSFVGLDAAQREFTFTGYTIEEDISKVLFLSLYTIEEDISMVLFLSLAQ